MQTRFAGLLLAGVLGVWLIAMLLVVRAAALPADAAGRMLVVFPPGHDGRAAHLAAIRAGAVPIRPTWLGFAWEVHGEAGVPGRLREQGALLVLEPVAFAPVMVGGCSFELGPALALRRLD